MRTYELVLVFDPALEMEQIDQDLRKLNEIMAANGTVRRWERWGKRRLTFEIAGRQYGYYVLSVFDSQTSAVAELDRLIRINAAVVRHLITVVDPKRVPEADPESVRTMGAAPDTTATPSEREESAEKVAEIAAVETPTEEKSAGDETSDETKTDA